MTLPEMRIKESKCPVCDRRLDAVTALNGKDAPRPGDWTACAYCATIMRFRDDLQMEIPAEHEMEELKTENNRGYRILMRAQELLREQIAKRATAAIYSTIRYKEEF